MIEIFIIKAIKENIKKGKYYTIDNKVISQNICIEDYFDNFGLEIRIHTDEDSLDNTIQIKHNGILIKEFNIDKNNLGIASLQEEYHEEKLSEVENAIIEKEEKSFQRNGWSRRKTLKHNLKKGFRKAAYSLR